MPLLGEEVLVGIDFSHGNIKQHFFQFVNIFAVFRRKRYVRAEFFLLFVAFVRHDDAQFPFGQREDLLILFRKLLASVEHHQKYVRFLEHAAGKIYAYIFHVVFRSANPGGIFEIELHAVDDERAFHHVARRAREGRNDRLVIVEQSVQKRTFSRIRPADDADLNARRKLSARRIGCGKFVDEFFYARYRFHYVFRDVRLLHLVGIIEICADLRESGFQHVLLFLYFLFQIFAVKIIPRFDFSFAFAVDHVDQPFGGR